MKLTKRVIMLVMTVALTALLALGAAVIVSANDSNDPIIIDMSSKKLAEKWLTFSYNEPAEQVGILGSTEFEDGALTLIYDQRGSWSNFRSNVKYTLKMKADNLLGDHKYMVVTYRTNITEAVPLKINNFNAENAENDRAIELDISNSCGRYVHSDPFYLDVNSGTKNFYNRLTSQTDKVHNLIYVDLDGKSFDGKYFYIKEIAFFTTEAEAKKYSIDPVVADMSTLASAETFLSMTASNTNAVTGAYHFDANEGALALDYANNSWANTHLKLQLKMKRPNLLGVDCKYMVVTYKTNLVDKTLRLINFQEPSVESNNITLSSNVKVSGGEYVRTEPINISVLNTNNNHFTRLKNGGTVALYLTGINNTNDFANKYFYIKEVAFFGSAEQAYEYYGIDPVVIDTSSEETAAEYLDLNRFKPGVDGGLNGNYAFDKKEKALSLVPASSHWYCPSPFRFTLRMNGANVIYGNKYMVVTYKTDIAESVPMYIDNFNDTASASGRLVIASDVSVSGNKYVRSEPVNINALWNPSDAPYISRDFYGRFNELVADPHNLIWVNTTNSNYHFYIKEIAFFGSAEEAKAYYAAIDAAESKGRIPSVGIIMMLLKKAKAAEGVDTPDAMIIDLSSQAKAEKYVKIRTDDSWDFGKYGFDTGEGLSFGYSTHTGTNADYNNIHLKFRLTPKEANMLTETQKYMVVTYKTNIDTKASFKLNNMWAWLEPNYDLTLADDISVSNGEWVRTQVIKIDNGNSANSNHYNRFNNPDLGNLFYIDCDISEAEFEGKYFCIKEVAFFHSEKDAKAYCGGN